MRKADLHRPARIISGARTARPTISDRKASRSSRQELKQRRKSLRRNHRKLPQQRQNGLLHPDRIITGVRIAGNTTGSPLRERSSNSHWIPLIVPRHPDRITIGASIARHTTFGNLQSKQPLASRPICKPTPSRLLPNPRASFITVRNAGPIIVACHPRNSSYTSVTQNRTVRIQTRSPALQTTLDQVC